MLTKESMPTARDPTLAPLFNMSLDRLKLSRAFMKWSKLLLQVVGRPEQRSFLKIISKIQKKRLAKKFFLWKHKRLTKEVYPL